MQQPNANQKDVTMTEKERKFITSEPISNDKQDTHDKIWKSTKEGFAHRDCIGYWRYPLFSKIGEVRKEPDIVIVDRELGLIILEIENITIDQLVGINGDQWEFTQDTIILSNPAQRSYRSLLALLSYCDREDSIFRKITGRAVVALPEITMEEWQQRGFDQIPNCPPIIFKNNLDKTAFFERICQLQPTVTGEQLNDEQWKILRAVVSGTPILRKPSGAVQQHQNRAAVLNILNELLYETDLQQEHIGKEIPPGVQRIRGIAGSGKTVLLCQKAANMYLKHPDWDIALVFFTRSLYGQIESFVDRWLKRFSNGEVVYDETVKKKLKILHAWGGSNRPGLYSTICETHGVSPLPAIRDLSPNEGLAECAKRLLNQTEIQPIFDAILIDEGQDLVSEDERMFFKDNEYKQAIYWMAYQALRPVNNESAEQRCLIWAYDEAQSLDSLKIPTAKELFGKSLTNLVQGNHRGGIKKSEIMHRCYRTPGEIITTAHALGMGLLRPDGMLQGLTNRRSWESIGYEIKEGQFNPPGQKIVLHRPPENSPNPIPKLWQKPVLEFNIYESRRQELEALAERIKYNLEEDGLKPSRDILIVVLGSVQEAPNLETEVGEFLIKKGIDVYIAAAKRLNQLKPNFQAGTLNPDRFWCEGGVTISRIHRAKGNEANMVYVVGVDKIAENESDPNLRNQLFVALTRSRGWACMSGIGDYAFYHEINQVIKSGDTFTFTYKKPPKINTGEEIES